jgi:hypothetical protein
MGPFLGEFFAGEIIRCMWDSAGADGASITRATNGTISVYKDNGTTQSTTGVTDTEDFDALTGVHAISIDTSADTTFYSPGSEFIIVLSGAVIDGKTVNAVLGSFALQRNFAALGILDAGIAQAITANTIQLRAAASFGDNNPIGATVFIRDATTGKGQSKIIISYVSATDTATLDSNFTTTPTGTIKYVVFGTAAQPDLAAIKAVTVKLDTALELDGAVYRFTTNALELAPTAVDPALASGTSDSGTTTTMTDAARTEADTDYWKGAIIEFTSGTIAGQCRVITGFNPATDTITFSPATTQAVGTNTYKIQRAANAILAALTHTNAVIPIVTDLTNKIALFQAVLPESYAAQGADRTAVQLLYQIQQLLSNIAISGTTLTMKNMANAATKTFTLNDGTSPTSVQEAT